MAAAAGVPVIPAIVWGGQRIFTKGRPKDFRGRGKAITVAYGEPITVAPGGSGAAAATSELLTVMGGMLDRVQHSYPQTPSDPTDRWWLPASLGGDAPTPEEAAALDAEDRAERGGV
jgi:hypothetical protein